MLGFNFLQSENYAAYEPFVNSQKKEKFTVAELESLVDEDDDMDNDNNPQETTTTMSETPTMPETTTMPDTTTTEPVEDEDMVMMEAEGVNEEQEIVLVEEDIPTITNTEPVGEGDEGDEDDEGDEENDKEGEDEDEGSGTEGFQGSKSVEYKFMKRVLIFLALFGLSYVLFKMYKLHKHKKLKVVYNKLKRVKIGKLSLDADIVMALLCATAIYLLLRLINIV
jgi:hypothetical protein